MQSVDRLCIDFESYSEVDLRATGVYPYAADASTDILCVAWAINDAPVQLWIPGDPVPDEVADHVIAGGLCSAWNSQFERVMWRDCLGPKYGWPVPALRQWECTMVRAYAMGLPGNLGKCAAAVKMEQRKDDAGGRIMLQLCKPRRTKKGLVRYTPESHPEKFAALYPYCRTDVEVERELSRRVKRLKPSEQELYWRDQRINDHGVFIDMPLVEQAQKVVDQHLAKLNAEMVDVTWGEVDSTTAVAQLKAWLKAGGLEVESLDKEHMQKLLVRDDLSNSQRVALLLRQEAAKTSTAKLEKFRSYRGADGRIRGLIQFHGASTGRDAARGPQVQNFPRPDKKTPIAAAIKAIMTGDAQWVEMMVGAPMSMVSDILRGIISVPAGKRLIAGDLSSIEARLTAYLSGQDDRVETYRRNDRIGGPDSYQYAAAAIYDVPVEEIDKEDPRRTTGKSADLALGFGGGAGAFASMAKVYRVDLDVMSGPVLAAASAERRERAEEGWKARGKRSGMKRNNWIASECVKLAWREANAETVACWADMGNAAIDAVANPGATYTVRGFRFRKEGSFLRLILLSGRSLYFPFPRIEHDEMPWTDRHGQKVLKPGVRFWGMDGYTNQWREQRAYGGFFFQNCVQACARDIMWEAVVRLEDNGFPNVMRVHDEPVCEVDEGQDDVERFLALLTKVPTWAPGLPVAAGGWTELRYRK